MVKQKFNRVRKVVIEKVSLKYCCSLYFVVVEVDVGGDGDMCSFDFLCPSGATNWYFAMFLIQLSEY